jgi:iron complex outermembrane receptor protein
MKNWKRWFVLWAVVLAVTVILNLFSIPVVLAQEEKEKKEVAEEEYELETITVTAQKRKENIQEVSVSITALSATQIEDSGIVNMDDVAFQIPNFHIVDRGDRIASCPYVRGIGEINPLNPVVALYMDDVCHATSGAVFDLTLFDIERIEVLRGPQGTLYGRNSLGGVINIITKKPENYFEGSTSVTYGNYDRWDIRAALRGPIVKDKLFLGIAANKNERDGYLDNTYLGTEPDEEDGLTGRAHLRWTPTDALDVTLSGDFERNHDNGCLFTDLERVRKDPHHISPDFDGFSDSDTNNQSLRVAYEVPWFKVISITGRSYWKNDYYGDFDFSPADMMRCGQILEETEWTQELRLQSREDVSPLKWLVGAYYFKEDYEPDIFYEDRTGMMFGMGPSAKMHQKSDYDDKGYALFGQATYRLFDKLGLTAGLRYARDEMDFKHETIFEAGGMTMPGPVVDLDAAWEVWLPKFAIDYRFTPDVMTYASVARGYNSGGFNKVFPDPEYADFDPEYTWNYEMGIKSSWLDKRLIINAAAFYIKWDDKQVYQMLTPTAWCTTNAGEAHSQGLELELMSRPLSGLEFVAGFGYTEAKFDKYEDLQRNFEDNNIPFAPKYTYNLASQYRYPLTSSASLFGRLELQGVGKLYFDEANTEAQGAYELINARFGFETEHFDVYIWGKNIFDEEYATMAFCPPGMGCLGSAGPPQTFGITVTGRF